MLLMTNFLFKCPKETSCIDVESNKTEYSEEKCKKDCICKNCIYVITCTKCCKYYVGQTKDFDSRFDAHLKCFKDKNKKNTSNSANSNETSKESRTISKHFLDKTIHGENPLQYLKVFIVDNNLKADYMDELEKVCIYFFRTIHESILLNVIKYEKDENCSKRMRIIGNFKWTYEDDFRKLIKNKVKHFGFIEELSIIGLNSMKKIQVLATTEKEMRNTIVRELYDINDLEAVDAEPENSEKKIKIETKEENIFE
jgi:hypothetical protein